jgi:hypothetical protein
VQVDALAVRIRPRAPLEAADLGARLCQSSARSVYACHAAAALPIMALALASFEVAPWLPGVLIWWSKPWLDRRVLFVLSRAAFGLATALGDLWEAQRSVWWGRLLHTWTVRRLSPWRSFTQPVHQLEGASLWKARKRVLLIRHGRSGHALLMTSVFALAETALAAAAVSLAFWFTLPGRSSGLGGALFGAAAPSFGLITSFAYAGAVFFLEPFYVAAGFAMYLNRRVELEAWDIEQEFRRAFSA